MLTTLNLEEIANYPNININRFHTFILCQPIAFLSSSSYTPKKLLNGFSLRRKLRNTLRLSTGHILIDLPMALSFSHGNL